jgi:hypothetical protein
MNMEATNDTVVMIQRDHCTREMNLSMLNAQSIYSMGEFGGAQFSNLFKEENLSLEIL